MSEFSFEPSLAEFRSDLDAARSALKGAMQGASEAAATRSAAAMRRRYDSRYPRRSGAASGTFRATGGAEPTVAFGGSSVPLSLIHI